MTEVERLVFLVEEIGVLKTKIREHDTGHIHTTISTLEWHIKEIEERGSL